MTKKLTKLFLICYKEFSLFLRMKEIKLGDNKIYLGDSKKVLQELPGESVDMIMTSPPYWALRDYRNKKQLGLEPDFNEGWSSLPHRQLRNGSGKTLHLCMCSLPHRQLRNSRSK